MKEVIEIVNKEVLTLTNCDKEPIHIPGAIQPHGYLIAVDPYKLDVRYCSANASDLFKIPVEQILQNPVSRLFGDEQYRVLLEAFKELTFEASFNVTIRETRYNVSVHKSGGHYILELERFPDGSRTMMDQYNQFRNFLGTIEKSHDLKTLCQAVAQETRAITGYDRVMIYRFDKDYNGEIFAESKRHGLDSLLGHHYPHTDIPVQARELYLKNLLRIIVDVNYEPVPLVTVKQNGNTSSQLDLSLSILRSVSPIHIEYLKNMGVTATMVISLIQGQRLWGLIACHHYSPRHIPFYTRLAAKLQGHLLSSQIPAREIAEEYYLKSVMDSRSSELIRMISTSGDFLASRDFQKKLLNFTAASAAILMRGGKIWSYGNAPDDDVIRRLVTWIVNQEKEGEYHTDSLPRHYKARELPGEFYAGILYFSLGTPGEDCVIWFRAEMEKMISWAGEPTKAEANGNGGKALTPRKSFELWVEQVRDQSIPWKSAEIESASNFARFLQRHFYLLHLKDEELKQTKVHDKLKKANEELENIAWIGTHDLREPLRKIQILGSRILSTDQSQIPQVVLDYINRMQNSANKMQRLIEDLLEYSKITDYNNVDMEMLDLNEVVDALKDEMSEEIREKSAVVSVDELPEIRGIKFQIRQLFINLLSNSLKFSKNRPVQIRISSSNVTIHRKEYSRVTVIDNGIGFDNAFKEKMFTIFQRLHHQSDYSGTGIGLSICKKVMENHGGFIDANGAVGVGATFDLYFPQFE